MVLSIRHRQKAWWIGALLAALLVIVGCAEIQPYNPPNHREEGPPKGVFTGSQGEWVIVGPKTPPAGTKEKKTEAQETETKRDEKKDPVKPVTSEQ